MKKSTKKTLGAGLLLTSIIAGVYLFKRGGNLQGFTTGQLYRARLIRNMAARQGIDVTKRKPQVVEPVLGNGMTQSYARKYKAWLEHLAEKRGMKFTHKHISPSSLALPVDEVVA